MEGIQTIQALKAVQSSLPAQTTIPSDELVMLYAADGTPIAKIARDDLVKAVASVMASNSQTTFSKLLGVQANGTPMGIGASDLASVLGAMKNRGGVADLDNASLELGIYQVADSQGIPSGAYNYGVLYVFRTENFLQQIYITDHLDITSGLTPGIFARSTFFSGTPSWNSVNWIRVDSFNCYTPSDLASLLGGCAGVLEGQTWDSLLIRCNNQEQYKPITYFVKGQISSMLSSDGTLVTLVKRTFWCSVIWSTGHVDGQVAGDTVTTKVGATFNETSISF